MRCEWVRIGTVPSVNLLYGVVGAASLLSIYFLTVSYLMSPQFALERFIALSYYMVPLIIGFGLQIGLYTNLRMSRNTSGHSYGVAGYGTVSSFSMVACCLHHLTDVVPILGLTTVSLLIGQFQELFLLVGLLSNIAGVLILIHESKKANAPLPNILKALSFLKK